VPLVLLVITLSEKSTCCANRRIGLMCSEVGGN
jgi:hypothetical protein